MSTIQSKFDEAFTHHQAGNVAAAAPLYRAILDQEPDHADALHMLGIIAQQRKNPELALRLMDMAVTKNPQLDMGWCNRATVLRVLDRKEEALQSVEKAITINPNLADAWDMAGSLLREAGKLEESMRHHQRAVELQPENVRFCSNYTVLLLGLGKLREAYQAARICEKLDKEFVPLTLGNVLHAAGYPERAIPYFKKSYEVLPDFMEAKLNEAWARMEIGDYEKGLKLWESRPDNAERLKHIPRWHGEKTKHLLLHEEQGMGDALQCLRYIPLIRDRAEKITLQLTGHLKSLLTTNYPDVQIITLDDPAPMADARIQLTSLPYICETRVDAIPANIPYLFADDTYKKIWQEKLARMSHPRIGLVWSGNAQNRVNSARSIPFDELIPLLKVAGLHIVSLQKNLPADQAKLAQYGVMDADAYLKDFSDTAGLISELDLIISICTGPLHLAGAMNKPAWVPLAFESDWRWMEGREDSPWYPSFRLFRQTSPGDWKPVIQRITQEIKKFLAGDKSGLIPPKWNGPILRQNPNAVSLDGLDA